MLPPSSTAPAPVALDHATITHINAISPFSMSSILDGLTRTNDFENFKRVADIALPKRALSDKEQTESCGVIRSILSASGKMGQPCNEFISSLIKNRSFSTATLDYALRDAFDDRRAESMRMLIGCGVDAGKPYTALHKDFVSHNYLAKATLQQKIEMLKALTSHIAPGSLTADHPLLPMFMDAAVIKEKLSIQFHEGREIGHPAAAMSYSLFELMARCFCEGINFVEADANPLIEYAQSLLHPDFNTPYLKMGDTAMHWLRNPIRALPVLIKNKDDDDADFGPGAGRHFEPARKRLPDILDPKTVFSFRLLDQGAIPRGADGTSRSGWHEIVGMEAYGADKRVPIPLAHAILDMPGALATRILGRLLVNGALDPDQVSRDGLTLLHRAVMLGRIDCVEMLLAQGANHLLLDQRAKTARDIGMAADDPSGGVCACMIDAWAAKTAIDAVRSVRP